MKVDWLTLDELARISLAGVGGVHAPLKRGIGFAYHPGLTEELLEEPGLLDFLELSPEVLCRERRVGGEQRLVYEPTLLSDALSAVRGRPLVMHGLGLSVGSLPGWNESYLDCLDALCARHPLLWHSEHLSFLLGDGPDGRTRTLAPLRVPLTDDTLDLLVPRICALNERFGVPFLLENLTYFLPGLSSEDGRAEVAFLDALFERANVYLMLDLHNFEFNARTFGFDPYAALARLRLDRLVEVHVAGGGSRGGTAMDVHGQMVSPRLWALLDWIAPRAPNLGGIVFEVFEEGLAHVGASDVGAQLVRARLAWDLHCATYPDAFPPERTMPSTSARSSCVTPA